MTEGSGQDSAELKRAGTPMLNLSHIACTEDGNVLAHFVLLFYGDSQPPPLTGTYNGGTFGPVDASKSSGNVWHYNVILPPGDIDIYSAQVGTTTLHNPDAYSGTYACGPDDNNPSCPVVVQPQAVYCTDKPLGSPADECAAFGLDYVGGKDDNLSGLTFVATQDAYLALVKSGSHGCGPGNSAYRVYVNVSAGDVLYTPVDQNISHVTYCACPAAQQ